MTKADFGVIGLGYVGLPLALEFANAGFRSVGVDVDEDRVARLTQGRSHVEDVSDEQVKTAVDADRFLPTTDYAALRDAETVSICVPTPLGKSHDPDVSFVVSAAEHLSDVLVAGQTVILESTVYPGATEELVAPILERRGLRAGRDFSLAFSPERIDPGNKAFPPVLIPKVVGGINEDSTAAAVRAYERVFRKVVPVGSTREAEMAKLLENTFRAVNIGLVNELAIMANGMGIDIWKVIDAAATKPFGYMPFYPGPGWGGHCIPVDPFYLTWRARMDGYESGFIDQAARINGRMPNYVVDRLARLLNQRSLPLKNARILLVGLAYKKNVADTRESPALDIARLLVRAGAALSYHDPHVSRSEIEGTTTASVSLDAATLEASDCVLIITDHSSVDYGLIGDHASLVFDTRNVFGRLGIDRENVVRL